MLMPNCGNHASRLSNTHPEPNVSDVIHSVSRTFTTNQPSPVGARPAPESSSCASGMSRLYPSTSGATIGSAGRHRDAGDRDQ